MAEAPTPPAGTAAGAVDPHADAKQLAEGMAGVRELLQRTGTAIGAVATAVIGGLGYTRLHDVFPVPETAGRLSVIILILSLFAAVAGSAWLAARFFRAQRRILLTSDLEGAAFLARHDDRRLIRWLRWLRDHAPGRRSERKTVEDVLREHAAEEEATSLLALELRALRLQRVSRRLRDPEQLLPSRETVSKEADRLNDFVATALNRASATLLEYRARRAFAAVTILPLTLAVSGIVGLFAVADFYKGERELFELREKCAKAEDTGVVNACAAFETTELTARRIADEIKKAVDARKKAVQAGPGATQQQKALLDRVAACAREVNASEATKGLDAEIKSAAIALCAASD